MLWLHDRNRTVRWFDDSIYTVLFIGLLLYQLLHRLPHRHHIRTNNSCAEILDMLAAATSFFARTNISQSYHIGQPPSPGASSSRPTTPGVASSSVTTGSGSGGNGVLAITFTPTFAVGLWKIQSAYHRVTNKRVSVWSFDKRGADIERLGVAVRDSALRILKAEVSGCRLSKDFHSPS